MIKLFGCCAGRWLSKLLRAKSEWSGCRWWLHDDPIDLRFAPATSRTRGRTPRQPFAAGRFQAAGEKSLRTYARSNPESSTITLEGMSSVCSVNSLTLRGDFIENGPTPEERAKTRVAFADSSDLPRRAAAPVYECSQAKSPGPNLSLRVGGLGIGAGARRCGAAFNRALRESGSNRLFG